MIARYIAAGLLACALSFSALAQNSLENLVSDQSVEWMFGNWQAQADNGDTVTLSISWDLAKHVVALHVKTAEMESKGYTVMEPKEDRPKYYSFDDKGSVGKGSWDQENGDVVLRVETETSGRPAWKAGFVFSGSASTGLQVRMHNIDSSGDLVTPAKATYKFKKQK